MTKADLVCLVRAKDSTKAKERLIANMRKYDLELGDRANRVHTVTGDLTQPLLGLDRATFDQLAKDIDVIIHNGADVNLAADYTGLRDVNVNGSREAIRLAMQSRLKPLHIVSSYAVLASRKNQRGGVVLENAPLPEFDDLANGYAQTKWVVERLVTQAKERGLPAVIYRPGNITGHSVTGASNTGDIMHTLVLAMLHIGAVPDIDLQIDLSPVDFVANGIVELAFHEESLGNTYHLTNPRPLSLTTMAKWLNESELNVETTTLAEWREGLGKLVDSIPGDVIGILSEIMTEEEGEEEERLPAAMLSRFDSAHTVAPIGKGQGDLPTC